MAYNAPQMSEDFLHQAEAQLLHPAGLSLPALRQALARQRVDWADIYIERQQQERWHLEEGIVKSGSYSAGGGIGLRAVCGETTAHASSDIVSPDTLAYLDEVAQTAKTRAGGTHAAAAPPPSAPPPRFGVDAPQAADADKIALLVCADERCRRHDGVENVIVSLSAAHRVVLVARADGGVAADYRPMVSFNVQVVMGDGSGKRETGSGGGGGRAGYESLTDERIGEFCDKAVADARAKLSAGEAPAGRMPVVLGSGWAGILLHEAVGHGLEGDFNRKRLSAFSGRIGEKVAADGVTVMDAGNIGGRRGSLTVDDEGTPAQETVLIEDGVLRGYMQDIVNARLMAAAPTGNGRRQSYAHLPMPRMTNTFMPGGRYAPEEIIASVADGIYADNFNGGEVDITNGNFVFVAANARRIRGGRLGETVKGATIIGNGPAIMPLISMVGNDFALDSGVGTCGKNGQWVPVGVGQPTVKIDALTVGGAGLRG